MRVLEGRRHARSTRRRSAKLELVCRKLGLRPGMRVLDLGCGWGGFAAFAAERYGVHRHRLHRLRGAGAVGASERYAHLPIDIRHDDYRNATGTYDAVVSIGLMEHVGPKNYRGYMELVDRTPRARRRRASSTRSAATARRPHIEPWFDKYIFPNAVLPHPARAASPRWSGMFVVEDVHNIGEHYDPTLMAWWHNFDAAWPRLARDVRRAVLPDVEVLPARLRRRVSRARDRSSARSCSRASARSSPTASRALGLADQRAHRCAGMLVSRPHDVVDDGEEAERAGDDRERRDDAGDTMTSVAIASKLRDRRGLADAPAWNACSPRPWTTSR